MAQQRVTNPNTGLHNKTVKKQEQMCHIHNWRAEKNN